MKQALTPNRLAAETRWSLLALQTALLLTFVAVTRIDQGRVEQVLMVAIVALAVLTTVLLLRCERRALTIMVTSNPNEEEGADVVA